MRAQTHIIARAQHIFANHEFWLPKQAGSPFTRQAHRPCKHEVDDVVGTVMGVFAMR
jgi:hypothetical protein